MRLRNMNGSIVMPNKVEGVVETRVKLSGKTHRLVDIAEDAKDNITGLLFHFPNSGDVFNPVETAVFVGNLPTEVANNILTSLLTDGFADISGFDYQKPVDNLYDSVFDEGASKPYYLSGMFARAGLHPTCMFNDDSCTSGDLVSDYDEEGDDDSYDSELN